MSYKKSEENNYKSTTESSNLTKSSSLIVIDCMLNGAGSSSKIQNIYTEVRVACGLLQKEPFTNTLYPVIFSNKPSLYGIEAYRIKGDVITFMVYKLFDFIEQKMHESSENDPSKKYLSTTSMKIIIKSKDSKLEETINEIIAKYPSNAPSVH